ncbi:MAG: D-2-hydroxyacid dehydrogenase [Thermomicrobiales bacterium]|jgi:phosphoglycerate dehydrogenase-like enzyme
MLTNQKSATARRPLQRVIIGAELTDDAMRHLRATYPDVVFDVVNDPASEAGFGDADAIIGWRLTKEQLANSPRLQWLQTTSAGVERVLTPEMNERGIVITNASGVHSISISEHIMAMMLAFGRGIPLLLKNQQRHVWRDENPREEVFELYQQSLMVVGVGDIGIALGERASGFGMNVIGVRRRMDLPQPGSFSEMIGTDALEARLPDADHVAICLPLTNDTKGLFSARMIDAMKPGAYIYNIGRGPIIDQGALVQALLAGKLGGAGLDVTDPEPLPQDSPLWDMPNVLITAHTSGSSPAYWERASEIVVENIRRWQADEPLNNVIDLQHGY